MIIPNTKNVTILFYRSYSCGNFLANILCYNKNFIPKISTSSHGGAYTVKDHFDIDIKHKIIMSSVPDEITELKKWDKYELGCEGFYNFNLDKPLKMFDTFKKRDDYAKKILNPLVTEILEMNGNTFIAAHGPYNLIFGKSIFPDARVIKLINDHEVNKKSKILKTGFYENTHHSTLKYSIDYIDLNYYFDIGTMFNETDFFNEIYKLLNWYDIEEKTLDSRVKEYYKKYISIYQ